MAASHSDNDNKMDHEDAQIVEEEAMDTLDDKNEAESDQLTIPTVALKPSNSDKISTETTESDDFISAKPPLSPTELIKDKCKTTAVNCENDDEKTDVPSTTDTHTLCPKLISQLSTSNTTTMLSEITTQSSDISISTPSPPMVVSPTPPSSPTLVTAISPPQKLQSMSVDEEDLSSASEITFSFRIENFSKLTDTVLSPIYYARNLPWRIIIMAHRPINNQTDQKTLSFYVQCNRDNDSPTWSCAASAKLRLLSFNDDKKPFERSISHVYYNKENDWGFSQFINYNDLLDPEKEYIQNDVIVLEVHVKADPPRGIFWDSKKYTGYIGLRNQGATCYMNSLLQTLYFTNQFRSAIYRMPTEADDGSSLVLSLQRVFYDLQFSNKPVGTKKLTQSFGWDTKDSFMQHDVQEFLRILLDKIESKMKDTSIEGTISTLFEGKMSSNINCKNVEYESTHMETFYDIQLNIKGKKNIIESFNDYIATATLDGDNKYAAGEHGLQDAEKTVVFVSLPPVLHLHLMRFQYDQVTNNTVKFNDRFEFYQHISLDKYIQKPESKPSNYKLHAVLVHSGNNHAGHYVVYINPLGDGRWCKFDDDIVSRCTNADAIENNFGGDNDDVCSNAYMLVYIRDVDMGDVLHDITENEIPTELVQRLEEVQITEHVIRDERIEVETYLTVNVLLEEYFEYESTGLFDFQKANYRQFKMKKIETVADLMQTFTMAFNVSMERMRLWHLIHSGSSIMLPKFFDYKANFTKMLIHCAELNNPWTIFLQLQLPHIIDELPRFDNETELLLVFKEYDPDIKGLHYRELGTYKITTKVMDLLRDINRFCFHPIDTNLTIYEEQSLNVIHKIIPNHNVTLAEVLNIIREITDSAIIIFEKSERGGGEQYQLATCEDYIHYLVYRVYVTFYDKNIPNDAGREIELSQHMTYDKIASVFCKLININPNEIQLFKCHNNKCGDAILSSYTGTLQELLASSPNKPKNVRKLFYQQLSMTIHDLENKITLHCIYLSSDMKEEKELILYLNKNATVIDVLAEAAKKITFSVDSTKHLRIVIVQNHKLLYLLRDNDSLEMLLPKSGRTSENQRIVRIEEIPSDELNTSQDELLQVVHFCKNLTNVFGIPFVIKTIIDEPFSDLKHRIQKRLNISSNDHEKYKFALFKWGYSKYIVDESVPIDLECNIFSRTYLQLEHTYIGTKQSAQNYVEKTIKII